MNKIIALILTITLFFSVSVGASYATDNFNDDQGAGDGEVIIVQDPIESIIEEPISEPVEEPISEPVELPIDNPITEPIGDDDVIHLPSDGIEVPIDDNKDISELPIEEEPVINEESTDTAVDTVVSDDTIITVNDGVNIDESSTEVLDNQVVTPLIEDSLIDNSEVVYTIRNISENYTTSGDGITVEFLNDNYEIDENAVIKIGTNIALISYENSGKFYKAFAKFEYDGSGKVEIVVNSESIDFRLNYLNTDKYEYYVIFEVNNHMYKSKLADKKEVSYYYNLSILKDVSSLNCDGELTKSTFKVLADGTKSGKPQYLYLLDKDFKHQIYSFEMNDQFFVVKDDIIFHDGTIQDIFNSGAIANYFGEALIAVSSSSLQVAVSEDGQAMIADLSEIGLGDKESFNITDYSKEPLRIFFAKDDIHSLNCEYNSEEVIITVVGDYGDSYEFNKTFIDANNIDWKMKYCQVTIDKPKSFIYKVNMKFSSEHTCTNHEHQIENEINFYVSNSSFEERSQTNDRFINISNSSYEIDNNIIKHSLWINQEKYCDILQRADRSLVDKNALKTYVKINDELYYTYGNYYYFETSFDYNAMALFIYDSHTLLYGSRSVGRGYIDYYYSREFNQIPITPWKDAFGKFVETKDEMLTVPDSRYDENNYEVIIELFNKDNVSVEGNIKEIDQIYIKKDQNVRAQIIIKDKASNLEYYLDTDISKGEINYDLSFLNNMKPTGNSLMKGMKYELPYFIKSTDTYGNRLVKIRSTNEDNSYLNVEIIPENGGDHSLVSLYSDNKYNDFHEALPVGKYETFYYIKLGDNFFTKVYSTFNVYDNTENKSVSSIIEGTSDADKYEITFGVSGISTSEIESINLYKSYKGKKTDIIKPANQNQVEIVGIEGQPDRIKAVIQKEKDMVGVHCMIIKLKSGYMYRVPTLICFDLPVTSNLNHDVNLDGKISSADALLVRKHLDGTRTLDKDALGRADANEDGKVDMTDAQVLLNWSLRN